MSSCIRVLSVQTIDSTPSLLVVSPDGSKTIVNCGEGTQRLMIEYGQKVATIHQVCLTHIGWEATGGLPGMVLTAADATLLSSIQQQRQADLKKQQKQKQKNQQQSSETSNPSSSSSSSSSSKSSSVVVPGLEIIGPNGTKSFLKSLRHFMRRDSFHMNVHEGNYVTNDDQKNETNQPQRNKKKSSKNKNNKNDNNSGRGKLRVESIATLLNPLETNISNRQETTTTTSNTETITVSRKRPRDDEDTGGDLRTTHSSHGNNTANSNNSQNNWRNDNNQPQQPPRPREVLSFLFSTPPIQGRFLADKAKELGIPKGPLYGQLKSGKTIVFQNSNGEDITVESHQVVEPSNPGVVIAILYYPTLYVLDQLRTSSKLQRFFEQQTNNDETNKGHEQQQPSKNNDQPTLQLIVHMTSDIIFESNEAKDFRSVVPSNVDHMFVRTSSTKNIDDDGPESIARMTPYHSAAIGSYIRSQISPRIYTSAVTMNKNKDDDRTAAAAPAALAGDDDDQKMESFEESNEPQQQPKTNHVVEAVPLLEYTLLPRTRQGFQNQNECYNHWESIKVESQKLLTSCGAIDLAKQIEMQQQKDRSTKSEDLKSSSKTDQAEILFTGTGSAIPCKHRNVSGIVLTMDNGNTMLMDIGEGTVGHLLRAKQSESSEDAILRRIKAVWISHPHADHHLGILRLLASRKNVTDEPLIMIAPTNIRSFLSEYKLIEPGIIDSYVFLDCREISTKTPPMNRGGHVPTILDDLQSKLGITSCTAVPVAHCPNAFAIVVKGTSFGSVAYSGDCRPSRPFAQAAYGADILIHEATFGDGMEAEAALKRHCTVGEAADIARRMDASTLLLTHFSQRYPKIPPLPTILTHQHQSHDGSSSTEREQQMKIIPCFDFMRITKSNLEEAAMITPALQLLYPEENDNDDDCVVKEDEEERKQIQSTLATPGLFANSDIL